MSSHKWYLEILGALILSKTNATTNLIAFSIIVGGVFYFSQWRNIFFFAAVSLGVLLVWHVVRTLTPIYCLRKQESRITWSQIILLASFGLWLLVVIMILGVNQAQVRKSVDSPPGMLTEDHHHTVHEERQVCYSSHLRPKSLHL